ncbi:MAG TPA: nucleotidyltransferase family protein [Azospirillaceae bacterium]|nr:nucleotidyltransferase family protein [Azospirillaceae bacterium]
MTAVRITTVSASLSPEVWAPKTAMVLAAGLGLRMRPLTLERPKPLLPVMGRSMLDHALDRLEAVGVGRAVVNAHYKGAMVADHLKNRARPAITISHEDTPLETGGGVKKALPLLGDDPIFVVNADIVWLDGLTPALYRLASAWDPSRMDALLLLMSTTKSVGYDGSGDFQMDPLGRLTRRAEGRVAPFVFAGVQIIKPGLFRDTPDGPFSTNLVWDRAMAAERLHGIAHDGAWFHVGTPEALEETNALLAAGKARWVEP